MPKTNQQPLSAPRRGDPHNFSQGFTSWEASIFDSAEYFFVLRLRGHQYRQRDEFGSCAEAVAFAQDHLDEGPCAYALSKTGRSIVLDREVWDQWVEREATQNSSY